MIAHLRGELIDRLGGAVIIDCTGVGYEVAVSGTTMAEMPPIGETVSLRIFTHAQENKIALYGFSAAGERELFDLLITVKRVGPASAIKILSAGAGPHAIAQMIASEQTRALTALKGVGKKTAEMIIVELKEKAEMLLATWGANGVHLPGSPTASRIVRPPAQTGTGAMISDVRTALVHLGFKNSEAERAVATLEPSSDSTLESLLKEALQAVPR